MKRTILTFLWVIAAMSAQNQDPNPTANAQESLRASAQQARDALTTLRKIVTAENFKSLGFDSREEAERGALGEAVVSYYIRLDTLRRYRSDADPKALLTGGELVIYPVLVNGQPRTSIEVMRDPKKGWTASGYGGAQFVRLLHGFRARAGQADAVAGMFEVRVPALRAHFLGVQTGGDLRLIPLTDDIRGRWKAGVSVGAREVMVRLAEDANQYNGLPL